MSQVEVNALGSDLNGAAQVGSEALPQLDGAWLGRGRQHLVSATSKTAARLILTMSFRVYSVPGSASQWQPEYARWRESSSG